MRRAHVLVVQDKSLLTQLENASEKVVLLRDSLGDEREFELGDMIYFVGPAGLISVRAEAAFISKSLSLPAGDDSLLDLYPDIPHDSGYIVGLSCVQVVFPMEVLEEPVTDRWTTFADDPIADDSVEVVRIIDDKRVVVDRISHHKARRLIAERVLEHDERRNTTYLQGKIKHYVKRRDLCFCRYCGHQFDEHSLTVDHVVPKLRRVDNHPRNLVAACHDCNLEKAHRSPDEYFQYLRQRKEGLPPVEAESLVFTDRAIRDIDALGIIPEHETVDKKVSFVRQLLKHVTSVEDRRSTLHLYCDFLKLTVVGRRYIVRVLPVAC